MKYFANLLITAAAAFSYSCTSPKPNNQTNDEWQTISIHDGHDISYFISESESPSKVLVYHGGSIFSKDKTITIDTLFTRFTQVEKDTLYKIVQDIITNPVKPKLFCTEYVGGLELTIYNSEQLTRSIRYRSTCDWSALSPRAKQLSEILSRHRKQLK